ncbi:MAG TPA: cytochrome P450, partial [Vicinamibacterales bacterium]
ELQSVLGGRTPTVEDVPKLEYCRAVIAESMRLFPPAWTMGRRAMEPHVIAGHAIEAGSLILMSQWVVHRDKRWWPEPLEFRPRRWVNSSREPGVGSREPATEGQTRPKYSYFPFGGGARICIGESFAWTEMILLLATIAQRWRFVATSAPQLEPRITLRPKNLRMQAVPR